jgi:hypothetical protein
MQIREITIDDLQQVNAVCDASGRARWTTESITPRGDRLVLAAVTAGEIIGVAKTHFHPDPDGTVPAGHYLGGHRRRSRVSAARGRFCPYRGEDGMDLVSGFERLLLRERT